VIPEKRRLTIIDYQPVISGFTPLGGTSQNPNQAYNHLNANYLYQLKNILWRISGFFYDTEKTKNLITG